VLERADDRIRDCPDPGDASEVAMDYHPNRGQLASLCRR
jgi:hypothetical protein